MAIPKEILEIERPKGTVVKFVNGHYYVVKRTSTYVNGRRVPKDLGTIGKIIDGKYVERDNIILKKQVDIKDYGDVVICNNMGKKILEALEAVFDPKDAIKIYVIALLRAVYGDVTARDLAYRYKTSYVSELYKDVALSESRISPFLESIGQSYLKIVEFMRNDFDATKANTVLIDGTLKNNNSSTTFSQWSRKGKVKNSEDMSILYAYDVERKEPVASKPFPGNMLDSTAFLDFFNDIDLTKCLIILDKGFWNEKDINAIKARNDVSYLIPTKRNASQLKELKLTEQYSGILEIADKNVQWKKVENDGTFYYSFKDIKLARDEASTYIKKMKKKGQFDYEKYAAKENSFGTIVFESNTDMDPKDIYLAYMERWEIEVMFKFFKSIVDLPPGRVHNDYRTYAIEFINLIAIKIACRTKSFISSKEKLDKYSYIQIMNYLSSIKSVRTYEDRNKWRTTTPLKYVEEIATELDVLPM